MPPLFLEVGTLDLARRQLVTPEGKVRLTDLEVDALEYLIRRAGEVVAREDLEREVWGLAAGVRSEAVPAAMRRLRSKLERDPAAPANLHTVRGQGWTFVLSPMSRRSNLPPAPTLFGREQAVARLATSLDPWTTVLGGPGWGKTAVALAAAERVRGHRDEVWFVPTEPDLDAAVRRVLGMGASAPVGPALAERGAVLVVVDAAETNAIVVRDAVRSWLADAPHLCVWTTSTQPLADETLQRLDRLDRASAVQLLIASAGAAGVTDLTADDEEVAAVVERLGHHPRALKLAGASTRVLAPAELRLQATAGPVGRELEAALEWSLRTLSDCGRAGLADAAWFEGAFDRHAAEAVLDVPDVPAVLLELDERSLLDITLGRPRTFRVPSAVCVHLVRSTGGAARHTAWALDRSTMWVDRLVGPDGPAAASHLAELDPELRAAARRADPETAVQLQWARSRGGRIVGLERLTDVPMAWEPPADIGPIAAPFLTARAMWLLSRDERLAQRTQDWAERLDPGNAWVRLTRARWALIEGRYGACLAEQRDNPPVAVAGDLAFAFAHAHLRLGNPAAAERLIRQTLASARARGDRLTVASLAIHPARWMDQPERCLELGPHALGLARQVGLVQAEVNMQLRLAAEAAELGRPEAAAKTLDRVAPAVRRRGEPMEWQRLLELRARVALFERDYDELEVFVAKLLDTPDTLATRPARCNARVLHALGAFAQGRVVEARQDLTIASELRCSEASTASALYAGLLFDSGQPDHARTLLAGRVPLGDLVDEDQLQRIVEVHVRLAEDDHIGASQLLEQPWRSATLAPWIEALTRRVSSALA